MTTPEDLAAIAALTDKVRRSAYQAVAEARPAPIGRDEVAEALGIGRSLAAFHLDKLVDAGLLEISYARRSGRTGPGAGRPAKLYRLAAAEHTVSVPPRSYRTAASLLAEALERTGADDTLTEVAHEHGRESGIAALDSYEPDFSDDRVVLRNCPFHQLAEQFPPLICGMNLALVSGLVEGTEWEARMDAAPGRCCVTLSKKQSG
ncbi:ArsR family transcriptional regulator [Actinoplanes sp. OR16]|uniref:helix-turn-helix transcriptional regulator n=1 Tax=Actinoplanes sp. OR16 TaxID=946334 RepID=UPI000F70F66A|nr:transcriptional regulator [Actinoplanes sp. OR16]BBH64275.1 ArsR family transcriptional regulator [Actinoplanes sp. OR16]